MQKHLFSAQQVEQLRSNPNTEFVSEKTIRFTPMFKNNFWDLYREGKSPAEIFLANGYDPKVLGDSRIGNFAYKLSKDRANQNLRTSSQQNEDLSRRLDALEYKMDQLVKAIEMASSGSSRRL